MRASLANVRLGVSLLAVLLAACGGPTGSTSKRTAPPPKTATATSDEQIELRRSGCEGTCPVYSVRITPSEGEFEGELYTAVIGKSRFAMTPTLYRQVAAALAPLRSKGLQQIDSRDPRCGLAATDMPGWGVTWGTGETPTRLDMLTVDGGCENPAARAIARQIEAAERMLPIAAMKQPPAPR